MPKGKGHAKWKRCVKKVKAKGGAVNPYAVCNSALKRKGKKGKQRR